MEGLHAANIAILVGASLILLGIASSLGAARFGAPLLLVFMGVGMLAGVDGPGGIDFANYQLTYLVGSVTLSVVLFDGGLRTRLSQFRGTLAPSLLLSTVGVVMTAAILAGAAMLILKLSLLEALLLGSIVASTDAAAVFFLLRNSGLTLQRRAGAVLEIESATNDPMAVFLTIVLTQLLIMGETAPGLGVLMELLRQGALGAMFGVGAGFGMVAVLNRFTMPTGLHPLFVVCAAVFIFAVTALSGGSGFLAVYLAGLVMANRTVRAYPSIVGFHDAASWLSQIVMFTMLGLLVTPSRLIDYALPGIALALVLTFVARPVAVWTCLHFFGFPAREKHFVSWVGLRGAVSIFLAAIPTLAGAPNAEHFFNTAFFVVLVSLLVQGWTLVPMARKLGVASRHTSPGAKRVEVDIPGQLEQELVGYPVGENSVILSLTRLPHWLRPIMVIRGGEILSAEEAGAMAAGDYIYVLTRPDRVTRMDRLFEDAPEFIQRRGPMFGEFPIHGTALLGDVCKLYDLPVLDENAGLTVADFIASRRKGAIVPGARVPLRGATLFVREVQEGRVTEAGLQLDELMATLMATARAATPEAGPFAWLESTVRRARAAVQRRRAKS